MKYIIMCGGTYPDWDEPRQLIRINGEPIVARTIRLLREAGVTDIAISTNDNRFEKFGVPILRHENRFEGHDDNGGGSWVEGFYLTDEPVCYLLGDVIFSPDSIKTIVNTDTQDVEFFASAPPFSSDYIKPYAEPFAFKVKKQWYFKTAIEAVKALEAVGIFNRRPIAWELWQVIKGTRLNEVITNYTVINDYTCDIDYPGEAELIAEKLKDA